MDPLIKSQLLCRLVRKRVASTSSATAVTNEGIPAFFTSPPIEVGLSSMRSCWDVLGIIGLLNGLIHRIQDMAKIADRFLLFIS